LTPGPFQPGRPDRALQEGRPPEQVRLKLPTADGLVLKSTNTTDDLEELAHDAGVDRAYLSRVERSVTYVGLEIIEKLATVLEVDPAEFFTKPFRPGPRRKAG
jgi:transcriptional regulator with XRE-family HTH domain